MGWGLWPLFSSKLLVIPQLLLGSPEHDSCLSAGQGQTYVLDSPVRAPRPCPANQTGLGTRGQLAKSHRLEVTPALAQSRWGHEGLDSHEGELGVTPA